MPKVGLNALALGALVAVSAGVGGGAGCSGSKPTELVPGVTTQIVVPHDLQGVRVTVLADGALVFDQGYNVGPGGTVQLPSTLGVLSAPNPSTVVSVTIRGYQSPCVGTGNAVAPDCSSLGDAPVGNGGPQVLRRSVQTFVDQRILFVPMPLSYSCWNNGGCAADQSCKGNQCVTSTTDSANLVDFDPALLDGTDVCFSPKVCFADALPAQLVDLPTCTYAVPAVPGVTPPPGLNVRIWYEDFLWTPDGDGTFSNVLQNGGEVEILNNDPTEGFTLGGPPDAGADDGGATTQELFQLAPGLCQLAQQAAVPPPPPAVGADGGVLADAGTGEYVTVSRVEVATGCPSKPALLPICQDEQSNASALPGDAGSSPDGVCNVSVNMTPTQSALYLAFDDSQVMNGAYGGMGSAYALSLSLSDPVFQRTYAASTFFHQTTGADCTAASTSYESPKIPFGLAANVQSKIANELLTWTAPDPGTMSCSPTGALDGGSTCSAGQICAGTGTANMFTCVTPDPLDLQAALRLNSGVYADISQFLEGRGSVNIAAAMFFLNRAPTTSNDCNLMFTAPEGGVDTSVMPVIEDQIAAAFNATPSLKTYFVVLDDDAHDTGNALSASPPGALTFFNKVQSDLGTNYGLPQAVTVLDATNTSTMSQAQIVAANFSKVVTQLGTCVYDYGLPSGYAPDQVQIAYQIPGQPKTLIPQDSNCDEANLSTVSGWNFDGGRVRICGQACSTLQTSILAATAAALSENLSAPDIGVTATVLCAPATGEVSDAAPVDAAPSCALTCVGCCDTFGNCLTGTTSLACGAGGQLCETCTGSSTCNDAGVCEGAGTAEGGTALGSGADATMVSSDGGG